MFLIETLTVKRSRLERIRMNGVLVIMMDRNGVMVSNLIMKQPQIRKEIKSDVK